MPVHVDPRRGALPEAWASNGCFETMRAYRGRIFRLDAHLDRLEGSATYLGVRAPERHRLRQQLLRALASSGVREAMVRVALIPRGATVAPHIVVQPAPHPPASAYRHGIRLAIVPTRKFAVSTIDPQAKYSARLGSVMAILEAQLRGADEALWMDAMGTVTESTASNFGIVRDGTIVTPPCWLGLLAGITREVLFELAQELRVPVREVPLTRHDVYNADEAFLTSTIKEVLPVTTIDGRRIGTGRPGPVTRRLHQEFRDLVEREIRHV